MGRLAADLGADAVLVTAADAVRRTALSATRDPHLADDVCQEAMARVLARRPDLEDEVVLPYAIAVARNLLASRARRRDVERRHAHRLVDLREPDRPDDLVDEGDERRSVREALDRLSEHERSTLVAHEVEGRSVRELAEAHGTSPGAIAVRMAGVRAKLRVEYLLSRRGVTLPGARCRSVLVALSAGDRRRQRQLSAGDHLLGCATCASLSEPLLRRDRRLAGWWPIALAPSAVRLVARAAKDHPVQAAASAAVVAGVVGGGVLVTTSDPPPPPEAAAPAPARPPSTPPGAAPLEVGGTPLLPLGSPGDLGRLVGAEVVARRARVLAVDADEGFWVGSDAVQRVWVHLRPDTGESPVAVRAGQRVSFRGVVTANPPGFAASVGLIAEEGADHLEAQGHHVAVPADAVEVSAPGRGR